MSWEDSEVRGSGEVGCCRCWRVGSGSLVGLLSFIIVREESFIMLFIVYASMVVCWRMPGLMMCIKIPGYDVIVKVE